MRVNTVAIHRTGNEPTPSSPAVDIERYLAHVRWLSTGLEPFTLRQGDCDYKFTYCWSFSLNLLPLPPHLLHLVFNHRT